MRVGRGSVEETSPLGLLLSSAPAITCIILFLSSTPTIKQIYISNDVGNYPLLPYISMFTQSLVWTSYGFLVHSNTVIIPNIMGTILGLIYTIFYHITYKKTFSKTPRQFSTTNKDQGYLSKHYAVAILLLLLLLVLFYGDNPEDNIGFMGMFSTILFNFSPLVVLLRVCREKSCDSMSFPLCLLVFWNSFFWVLFGWFVRDDYTLYVPNGLSFIAGCIQIFCFLSFGNIKQEFKFLLCYSSQSEKLSDGEDEKLNAEIREGNEFQDVLTKNKGITLE
eukprot:snap_masked-scaffold_48-processed-gene-0.2-mRNA-1 protein AED:1.00 eAED:1.00 QI:0/-1/0/0/-1/1/1/0/277